MRLSSCSAMASVEQVDLVAAEARAGKLFGVWNTDDANDLRLVRRRERYRLVGRKILASGAGHIERPLVTATDEDGRRMMVLPRLRPSDRADLSGWTAQGMRASATGAVDFTGIEIDSVEILGRAGDYERQPWFSGRRVAFRRRATGRHGETVRSPSPAFAGDQPRTGPSPGGASGRVRYGG